jgi:hypothetical protein
MSLPVYQSLTMSELPADHPLRELPFNISDLGALRETDAAPKCARPPR